MKPNIFKKVKSVLNNECLVPEIKYTDCMKNNFIKYNYCFMQNLKKCLPKKKIKTN